MSSSPAGLRCSQADLLARWMPSSTRAGVILGPGPDLAGCMRDHDSAAGSPDDSFASDFAPLPAGSVDSSCLGQEGLDRSSAAERGSAGGEEAGTQGPRNGLSSAAERGSAGGEEAGTQGPGNGRSSAAERGSAGGEEAGTQGPGNGRSSAAERGSAGGEDLPIRVKLEQLRKWQQHMQEQLKAHQLEELLRLQEEQQRLLGMINGSQHGTEDDSETSGLSDSRETPPGSTRGLRQEQDCEEVDDEEEEGSWNSRGEDQDQSVDISHFHEHDVTLIPRSGVALTEDGSREEEEEEVLRERPIKPGIGGQKKTFEELLEEQLRVEEQRLKSARQQQSHGGAEAPPKRAFLRRGEGLSRFTIGRKASLPQMGAKKDPKPQLQARGISRSNSEPTAIQRGGTTTGVRRVAVQRKTATLNKENRPRGLSSPPQDGRVESKAARLKVLGSHQRQNTAEAPESIQSDPEGRRPGKLKEQDLRKSGQVTRSTGPGPDPVTRRVDTLRGPETAAHAAAAAGENSCGSREESADGGGGGVGGGVPQDSFESSFQEKLRRWDCDRQVETMELGEFELLEQAAEEMSFSSNSSFVIKVLQMDQQHRGFHPRRLSSTPIKSPPGGAHQRCGSSGSAGKSSAIASDALVVTRTDEPVEDERVGREDFDGSTCDGAESEEREAAVKPPLFAGAFCFPAQSNPPYDKRSYQDEDSSGDSISVESSASSSDASRVDDVIGDADDSTLIEDRVVFDDDDTWNDLEDTAVGSDDGSRGGSPAGGVSPPPPRILSRKVAASKVVEVDEDPDPLPPASQLMTRLFPSLKPKAQNAPLPPPPPPPPPVSVAPESKNPEETTTGQQLQSRQLRERLVELEIEIERFKKENSALSRLRQENERNQERLRKERLAFEQTRAEELAKLEEHKKEENRKLQKERKLFEKHASAARAIPDKKEREEIQVLKQQLSSLQEELRGRESRWASSHSRLRQQIDSLGEENAALRDEIQMLEKLRLSTWKRSPVHAEKDKDTRDGVSSVTKGVKFASPLDSRGGGGSSISPPQSGAATRRSSHGAAAGMKSSLRRPSAPCFPSSSSSTLSSSSSSSLPGRRADERSAPASKNQDKPPSPEPAGSPENVPLTNGAESSEDKEPESAEEAPPHPDGKVETLLAGGDRLVVFNNGTKKEVSADGLTAKVTFFNGDTKEVTADQRVIYFYAEAQTTHITFPDGVEVLHFPNNQTEKHFPDGRKEILYPDQTVKNLFPGGREESVLTDGTVIQVHPDGTKEILFNTGQKEVHTADHKRREYPDGTVKTVYADGRQETRYPNGRLRIKDRDGNVVLDSGA